jgi:hypothetical protein
MKIRMLVVAALTALAVSGLFSTTANAQDMQEYAACGPFPPEEEAYLQDPRRTMEEIHEHWEVNKVRYCATLVLPAAEANEAAYFIGACLEPHMPRLTKAAAEACIAEWQRSRAAPVRYMHRHAGRRHKARHRTKRHAYATTALAGGFSAR